MPNTLFIHLLIPLLLFCLQCTAQNPSKKIGICLSFNNHLNASVYLKQTNSRTRTEGYRICYEGKSFFFFHNEHVNQNVYDTLLILLDNKQQQIVFKSGNEHVFFESNTLLEFSQFKPGITHIKKLQLYHNPPRYMNVLTHKNAFKWNSSIQTESDYRTTLPPFFQLPTPSLRFRQQHPKVLASSDSIDVGVYYSIYHNDSSSKLVFNLQSNQSGYWKSYLAGSFMADTSHDPCLNKYTYYFKTDSGIVHLPGFNVLSAYLQTDYTPITVGWYRIETKNRMLNCSFYTDSLYINTTTYTDKDLYQLKKDTITIQFNCAENYGIEYNGCWGNYMFELEVFNPSNGLWEPSLGNAPFARHCVYDKQYQNGFTQYGTLKTPASDRVFIPGKFYRFKATVYKKMVTTSEPFDAKVIYTNSFKVTGGLN